MRLVLICASLLAMLGIWPILRLQLGKPEQTERKGLRAFHPYLLRFLPAFAIWSFVTGSFIPFAPIFLRSTLACRCSTSASYSPRHNLRRYSRCWLRRSFIAEPGRLRGLSARNCLLEERWWHCASAKSVHFVLAVYLLFTAAQFAASPGFYGLLMSRLPDAGRSSASAAQNITGALVQAGSAGIIESLIVRFGYSTVFGVNVVLALMAAVISFVFLFPKSSSTAEETVGTAG